mmetsp:Transcript_9284/g.25135  ORF Transcript_9284/g.25135 Transcript_9284/m.25135 type:complete len:388 (-) Transcript_9284:127-1290(-)
MQRIEFIAAAVLALMATPSGKAFHLPSPVIRNRSIAKHGDDVRAFAMEAPHNHETPAPEPQGAGWSIEEEWALLDQLPKFTVGEGGNARTFWAQLQLATPLLSNRDEAELLQHCAAARSGESTQTMVFGPSPPMLNHWTVAADGRISGQTEEGRSVWMTTHVIGRLQGDPLVDSSSVGSGAVCQMMPGGYIEAVGGRVYELGHPLKVSIQSNMNGDASPQDTARRTALAHGSNFWGNAHNSADGVNDGFGTSRNKTPWWLPATTATIASMVSVSVLSACIGYGAGLSILSDGSHTESSMTQVSAAHITPVSITTATSMSASSIRTTSDNKIEPSISEQRARTEARVLREERVMQVISGKLEQDMSQLVKLRQLEHQQFLQMQWSDEI